MADMPEDYKAHFAGQAAKAEFMGKPVADMDRDELLAVIGSLGRRIDELEGGD